MRPSSDDEKPSFSKTSYQEMEELMILATDWLADQGIRYYQTRIEKYSKDLWRLNQAYETDTVQKLIDNGQIPIISNSLFESSEVISIYRGLHPIAVGRLAKQLKAYVRGTESANAESSGSISNRGRDIGFELYMASLFARTGYELDFGTDADIVASDKSCTLIVECKRPRADHAVHSHMRAAIKQIERRFKDINSKKPIYGIVCLSGEKFFNSASEVLIAPSDIEAKRIMESDWQKFAFEHQKDWLQMEDPRLLGLLMFHRAPGLLQDRKMLATYRFITARASSTSGEIGLNTLTSLVSNFKPRLADA